MRRVRWGVVGAGGIARRRTIPEGLMAAENAELAAVYDVHDCEAIASEFGVRACATEDELLAADIDAVYIATPVHLHAEQVERAALAGRHVFCEKPIGLNVSEAAHAIGACRGAGVKLGVGLMMRFHSYHRAALAAIEGGQIGAPVLGRAQLSCWYPPMEGAWRQDPALGGGGCLMDMGCHCIDLLEMFFGPVRAVSCQIARRVHAYPSEDTSTVLLEFSSGAQGIVDNLFNVPDAAVKNRLELYGSSGSIIAEGTIGQAPDGRMWICRKGQTEGYDAGQAREAADFSEITPIPVNTYQAQIQSFSQAILDDTAPPIDGEHGLWNQRVIEACYESARTGRKVAV